MALTRRNFLKTSTVMAAGLGASTVAFADVKTWHKTTDVVVVGLGGAGMTTAVVAADNGANCIIIERQPKGEVRSNTRMSAGTLHTPAKDCDRAALKEYALAMMSGANLPWKLEPDIDAKTAEAFADDWAKYCPEVVDFLKSLDPAFNVLEPPRIPGREMAGRAAFPDFPGALKSGYTEATCSYADRLVTRSSPYKLPKKQTSNGEALHLCLLTGVENRKDKIEVDYDTRAQHLVKNDKGEVVGVIAYDKNGKEIAYRARKAVVLASGGFEYSRQMRKAFLEGQGIDGWAFYGTPFNEGDGIKMGLEAGAGLCKVASAASRLIFPAPVTHNGMRMGIFAPVVGSGRSILVNQFGKRYVAEHKVTTDPSRYFFYRKGTEFDIDKLVYPNSPSWLIFDENLRKSRNLVALENSTVGYGFINWGSRFSEDAIKKGWILKADTIEELGEKIKAQKNNCHLMKPEDLVASVKRFNELCQKGVDDDFGRTKVGMQPINQGPFYAMELVCGGPNTKGGLATNAERAVIDWDDKPIPGLYALGEIASVFKFVYQGGGNLTECLIYGQVVGKEVAKLPNRI